MVKVADFGLAKCLDYASEGDSTQAGDLLGTPQYMSPEQAVHPGEIDIRADLYATGATLYHMVTGQKPFGTGNFAAVMLRRISQPFPDPQDTNRNISDRMRELILRMTHRAIDERHQTPAELLKDLDRVIAGKMPKLGKAARVRRKTEARLKKDLDNQAVKDAVEDAAMEASAGANADAGSEFQKKTES